MPNVLKTTHQSLNPISQKFVRDFGNAWFKAGRSARRHFSDSTPPISLSHIERAFWRAGYDFEHARF